MIVPTFKPYGQSTHLLAQRVGQIYKQKATHTGTLDPAAEGVVVVLTGDDRFRKQELANTKKVYIADILLGVSTDSHDLVGFPTDTTSSEVSISKNQLKNTLSSLVGKFSQQQPNFSAQRIAGESYFDLAKRGVQPPKQMNDIEIYSIELLSSIKVPLVEIREYHKSRLAEIEGDLRQKEITDKWIDCTNILLSRRIADLPLISVSVTCSKRTYIRGLVRDISEELEVPAVLYSLVRAANGPYTVKDCICLL